MPRAPVLIAIGLLGVACGCTHWFFSGVDYPDRSRPVAMIETRGGVEFGASTPEGILFLGRTAQTGPCRVHYFLGEAPTPVVENGEIRYLGSVFYVADIGLESQAVEMLPRDPTPEDPLVAIVHHGLDTVEVPVRLATSEAVEGDVLAWPGAPLPAGTGIFTRERDDGPLLLVGLVSGMVSVQGPDAAGPYLTMASTDRVRELLAVPRRHPPERIIVHRPDDISVMRTK